MVGEDSMRNPLLAGVVRDAGQLLDLADETAQNIGLVDCIHTLHDHGHALESHPGIDARPRKRRLLSIRRLAELHEDKIPELEEALPVLHVGLSKGVPPVEKNLGTGSAGADIPHAPVVVFLAKAHDPVIRQAGDLLPQLPGLIVLPKDGGPEPGGIETVALGDQFPGKGDGILLEVIPEGEVAQHLKEGQVAARVADIVEIVVLAPGPYALLHRGGARMRALLAPGEDVLELHHARVGKEERLVSMRNRWARRQDSVVPVAEIIQKLVAYFRGLHSNKIPGVSDPRSTPGA